MENIVGHTAITSYLQKSYVVGALHHAYLFVGPAGVGKRTFAEHFAAHIFDIPSTNLIKQPDYLFIAQEKNPKTGKLRKDITIDQIRAVTESLYHRPLVKEKKIVIIDQAERINTLAANALLKTLEEPKSAAVLFLISTDQKKLPQTIQSRCQIIHFGPVSDEELGKNFSNDATITAEMYRYAAGLPGRLFDWSTDPTLFESYKAEIDRFNALFSEPFHKKLARIDSLFGKKTDHARQRTFIYDALGIWLEQIVRIVTGKEKISESQSIEQLVSVYDAIVRARVQILKNMHPRLVLESILLTITPNH